MTTISKVASILLLVLALNIVGEAQTAGKAKEQTSSRFGAIAVGQKSKRWGVSTMQANPGAAHGAALNACRSQDCRIMLIFENSCAALARSEDGGVTAVHDGNNLNEAWLGAFNKCSESSSIRCEVVFNRCTGGSTP